MDDRTFSGGSPDLIPVADNVWIVDDGPLMAAGLPLPIRMTVIRLAAGELILHSATPYAPALRAGLEALGPIRYLLAPSVAHWMFLPEWRAAAPDAMVLAAPGLARRRQVREARLAIDRELADAAPEEWREEIETVLISAPLYAEVALFHRPSRTLVLTDLVQNIPVDGWPFAARTAARALGIAAPHGRAPAYLRVLLRLGGRTVEQAAARLIAFSPDRVVFAHGAWFERDATQRLRRSLRWLTRFGERPASAARAERSSGLSVVITGASSGIGRATALAFARRGASVVLAARPEAVLQGLARECEALGGHALVAPTDVTDADAVLGLAQRAEQAFGGVDVWINNAGTGVFGAYQDADMALHRRTVEVNLLGSMHGAFAALPIFLRQNRGVLINNISVGGWTPTPYAAAYAASKFGLRGFTASLRQELAGHPDIHVCAVFPAMVDTPGFAHGANMSGRNLDPGPLLYEPEDVAETFVRLVRRPRDETAVGWPARAGQIAFATAPGVTERLTGAAFRFLLSRAKRAERNRGAMIEAAPAGVTASGGWLARKSLPPAGQVNRIAVAAGLAVILVGAFALARRRLARPA